MGMLQRSKVWNGHKSRLFSVIVTSTGSKWMVLTGGPPVCALVNYSAVTKFCKNNWLKFVKMYGFRLQKMFSFRQNKNNCQCFAFNLYSIYLYLGRPVLQGWCVDLSTLSNRAVSGFFKNRLQVTRDCAENTCPKRKLLNPTCYTHLTRVYTAHPCQTYIPISPSNQN